MPLAARAKGKTLSLLMPLGARAKVSRLSTSKTSPSPDEPPAAAVEAVASATGWEGPGRRRARSASGPRKRVLGWARSDFVPLWVVSVELLMGNLLIVSLCIFWHGYGRVEEVRACYWARRIFFKPHYTTVAYLGSWPGA